MADEIDSAAERTEDLLQKAIATRKTEAPGPIGICLNCFTPVQGTRRWCCVDCRDDWEKDHD